MDYIEQAASYLSYAPYYIPLYYASQSVRSALFTNSAEHNIDDPELQDFLKNNRIRTDLKIRENFNQYVCFANGSNLPFGEAEVNMAKFFKEADPDAYNFILKHELSHIKHNDNILFGMAGAVASCAAAILLTLSLSPLFATIATSAIGFTGLSILSNSAENRADQFAISNSSDEELKGGIRFFKGMQEFHKDMRTESALAKIYINSSGDNNMDLFHPRFSQRIEQIRNELKKRNIQYSDSEAEQDPRIEKLHKLIQFNFKTCFKKTDLLELIELKNKMEA